MHAKMHAKTSSIEQLIFCLTMSFALGACSPKESLEPLYDAEPYEFNTIKLDVSTTIDDIAPVEPTGIRRFVYKIPIVNRLLALPLDITNALLPPLPYNEYLDVPKEDLDIWADPEFLTMVKSLKLKEGWLREKRDDELTPEQVKKKNKKTWLCKKEGLKFINSLAVVFEYTDRRIPNAVPHAIPIAWTGNSKKYYDENLRKMTFEVRPENVRPFIDNFNDVKLKLKTTGGFPCVKTYIQAGFTIEVELKLAQNKTSPHIDTQSRYIPNPENDKLEEASKTPQQVEKEETPICRYGYKYDHKRKRCRRFIR